MDSRLIPSDGTDSNVNAPMDRTPPSSTDLSGRVAVVTGSSRGLGAATALRLATLGAELVVTYRSQAEQAAAVAEAIKEQGGRARIRPLDLASVASIDDLFGWIAGSEGPGGLDILVANAASTAFKPLLKQKPYNIARTLDVSVTGFLVAVQHAVPLMQQRGGGRIVAVSGIDTRAYGPSHGLLAAAKAAMEMLVKYLHVELSGTGITVIGVNADVFRSKSPEFLLGEQYERIMRFLTVLHPMGSIPSADDLAEVVALCCTDASMRMAGATVDSDAGAVFALAGRIVEFVMTLPDDVLDASIRAMATR